MEKFPTAVPKTVPPKWAKIVLRTVGIMNVALALFGAWAMEKSVRSFLIEYTPNPSFPYFRLVFVSMALINITFVVVLLATALRFIGGRISSVNSYSLLVFAEFLYSVAIHILWAPEGIGRCIAAATGIGNMGIALFEFCFLVRFLYPVTSVVLLQVVRLRYSSPQTETRSDDMRDVWESSPRPALSR